MTAYSERLMARPAVVYSHVNADGDILYVGVTNGLRGRTRAHQMNSPWWPEVAGVHVLTPPITRVEALAEEAALLARLNPPHNVFGTERAADAYRRRGEAKRRNNNFPFPSTA